jgi:hypothetical protein
MIKAKDGYLFWKRNGWKTHLSKRAKPICGASVGYRLSSGVDTAEESEICKTCLKIARKLGLIEEVPEHIAAMPKGYRIMEVGEVITESTLVWSHDLGPWSELSVDSAVGTDVTKACYLLCCPIESQKPAEVSDNEACAEQVSDKPSGVGCIKGIPRKKRRHTVTMPADEYNKIVTDRKNALARIKEFEAELESARQAAEIVEDKLLSLRRATNGHTMENVAEIMKTIPKLDGFKVEYRHVKKGDLYVTMAGIHTAAHENLGRYLVCIPIVKYYTGEITDELVAKHGRIPCEYRTSHEDYDGKGELLRVHKHQNVLIGTVWDAGSLGAYQTPVRKGEPMKYIITLLIALSAVS